MFRTAVLAMDIFWLMDIMDMGFMEKFDTTYPLNGIFWLCTFLLTFVVSCMYANYEED